MLLFNLLEIIIPNHYRKNQKKYSSKIILKDSKIYKLSIKEEIKK